MVETDCLYTHYGPSQRQDPGRAVRIDAKLAGRLGWSMVGGARGAWTNKILSLRNKLR